MTDKDLEKRLTQVIERDSRDLKILDPAKREAARLALKNATVRIERAATPVPGREEEPLTRRERAAAFLRRNLAPTPHREKSMFRRTRIFIAFAVGLALICMALTSQDSGTQLRIYFAGMLWFFFCIQVGRMIENSQAGKADDEKNK